jgi:hypothetical protein
VVIEKKEINKIKNKHSHRTSVPTFKSIETPFKQNEILTVKCGQLHTILATSKF